MDVFDTSWFDSGCVSRQFTEAGPDCTKLWFLCSFIFGRRRPLRFAVAESMVKTVQQIIGIRCRRSYLVVDVPVMRAVQSLRCRRGEDIRAFTLLSWCRGRSPWSL